MKPWDRLPWGSSAASAPDERKARRDLSAWPPRRIASWSMSLTGMAIVLQHLVAHAGERFLPLSMGWQDVLVGYPTGALLVLAGLIVAGPRPPI